MNKRTSESENASDICSFLWFFPRQQHDAAQLWESVQYSSLVFPPTTTKQEQQNKNLNERALIILTLFEPFAVEHVIC